MYKLLTEDGKKEMNNSKNYKENKITDHLCQAFSEMNKVGHVMESGTMEFDGGKFSYKIRRLKK